MTGLDTLREHMTAFLTGKGIQAVTAWPEKGMEPMTGAVCAVSVKDCVTAAGGFQDYLGERYDEEAGVWREVYGQKVKVTFGLDLYAPREGGGADCQKGFDKLCGALGEAVREGLRTVELHRGETAFDKNMGLYHCPVEAVCNAYLYALTDGAGAFLDFEVKGYGNDSP